VLPRGATLIPGLWIHQDFIVMQSGRAASGRCCIGGATTRISALDPQATAEYLDSGH
jgi:hypothetical protein